MPYTLQFKRYSTIALGSVTGAAGEIIVDTTKKTVTIHDAATVGGTPLATEIFVSSAATSILNQVAANYTLNSNLTSTLTSYATKNYTDTAVSSAVNTVSSYLVYYTQSINLTSTLTNYPTNANLTSTLSSYQLTTSTLTLTNLTANTVTIIDSSNATSVTSGALRVNGGLSLTKDLFIGGGGYNININNILTIGAGTISRANGDFYLIGGGSQLTRNSLILSNSGGAILWGGSATNNSPATTGIYGIRLAGGDGNVSVINSSDSTSISTGSLVVNGGLAVAKTLYVSNIVVVNSITSNAVTTTGNLAVNGTSFFGTPGYTKSGYGAGDNIYDNGTGDTPGCLWYYGNNTNYGVDVYGNNWRVTKNLNESGGSELLQLNTSGNLTLVAGSLIQTNRPAFRVVGNGATVSATTTITNSYWSLDYQQGTALNTSTGLFTAPLTGLYHINVIVRTFSNTNSSINQVLVYKVVGTSNTVQLMVEFGVNTTANHMGGSTISKLNAGEQLKFVVSAGTISFDSNDNWSVAYIG